MRPVVAISNTAARPIKPPPIAADKGVKLFIARTVSKGDPERDANIDRAPDHHIDEWTQDQPAIVALGSMCGAEAQQSEAEGDARVAVKNAYVRFMAVSLWT